MLSYTPYVLLVWKMQDAELQARFEQVKQPLNIKEKLKNALGAIRWHLDLY